MSPLSGGTAFAAGERVFATPPMPSMSRYAVLALLVAASIQAGPGAYGAGAEPARRVEQAAARAAESDAAMDQMMRADVNRDGTISRDEVERFDSRMEPRFKTADLDHDGKLNLREFERLRALSRGATSARPLGGTTAGGSSRR